MKHIAANCLIWISLMVVSVLTQEPTYVATFSMAGASGTVTFTQLTGQQTAIGVRLSHLPAGSYDWTVRQRPTLYDQRPACSEVFTGGVLAGGGDLTAAHGQLTGGADVTSDFTDAQLTLTGAASIFGRSLVLVETSSSTRVCANILDFKGDVVTAVAQFMSPFAGIVTFRQQQGSTLGDTSVLVDLYDVLGPFEAATYRWGIRAFVDYNKDMDLQQRCRKTMSSIFNPAGADASACRPGDFSTCPVGDLSGKLGEVIVNPVPSSQTQYFIDTNLPLDQSANSVLGLSLVFADSEGTYIACSPIQQLLPKTVSADISVGGINGSLVFDQRSPYDATHITVNLANLQGLAGGYHVHLNPIPKRITKADKLASDDVAGGHFNPFNVVANDSPAPGTGTHDQYEVGDISGKFGFLTNRYEYSASHVDWNMQLYGKYSIVGRSIVIHKTMANKRWAYGCIGYPSEVKTVQADFHAVVAGKIVFRQDANDPFSDTSIYVDLMHADGADISGNHNFHVHQKPVGNDYTTEAGRCASTAGHFNPFVEVKSEYSQCSFSYPLRCEVGDLSQKLDTMSIADASGSSHKYFFTDPLLPLTGIYSVSHRSIVIHVSEKGAARYACANLYDVPSMSLRTGDWVGGSPATGAIVVTQASEFDGTLISIQLPGFTGDWYIHSSPIDPESPDGQCSAASVQDRYNPFEVTDSPTTGTHDMYEVGDLSGKFGALDGTSSASYRDSNLPLSGPRSVAGRSVVIRANSGQAICSDVDYALTDGDFTLMARANFRDQPNGAVIFKQIRFASGYLADTMLMVNFTSDVDGVEYQLDIPQSCTGESLYNPHGVSMFTSGCSTSHMKLCCVGDLVNKHGIVYSNQRALYTDTNLPLFGLHSVVGRPLAVRVGSGARRCSHIEPDEASGHRLVHVFPSTKEFDAYEFQTTVATAAAGGNRWQVVTSEEPVQSTDLSGCNSVGFWVIGPNVAELVDAYDAAVIAGSLGPYNPTELCSEGTGGGTRTVPSGLAVLLSTLLLLLFV